MHLMASQDAMLDSRQKLLEGHSVIVQKITTPCEIMQENATLAGCCIIIK